MGSIVAREQSIVLMEGITRLQVIPKLIVRRAYSILSALIVISVITPYLSGHASTLEVPQPIYPSNNSTTTSVTDPPVGLPLFKWSSVPGAVKYRLQVDHDNSFTQPVMLDITTQSTSYIPVNLAELLPDGEWYWHVRVDEPSPSGNWSTTYHFWKLWATPENSPDLLYPNPGELLAFFDSPAFSWTPVEGAASYLFQIAEQADGFATPVISIQTLSTTYQPPVRLSNRTYYWRVVPVDAVGHPGTPSNGQSFIAGYGSQSLEGMVPTLISPEEGSIQSFSPTFHWTAVKGAQFYHLEYTSEGFCDFTFAQAVETQQTSYTPSIDLPNAFRYCWRVRAESGTAAGDWSSTAHFRKAWNIKPILLTPTNLYQTGLYPIYSWTPVAGASRYLIQIAQNSGFNPIFEEGVTINTSYSPQGRYDGTSQYYWRVIPIDSIGEHGASSDIGIFQSLYDSLAPILIYPQYDYLVGDPGDGFLNPHEQRKAAFPIFIWHRVVAPAPNGGEIAKAYRVQVDDLPNFDTVDWQVDTENTSATPTASDPFIPEEGLTYYWRVCPLNSLVGGDCLINPETDLPWWSQSWMVSFDETLELTPSDTGSPKLLRPTKTQEFVEASPLLEWWPMLGSSDYQVQVSRDADFSTTEITQTVTIPAYSARYSLAQRSLDRTAYGTFYWRVRGLTQEGWSPWSDVWRFQVASQSEWRYSRTLGNIGNRLRIGDDPAGDAPGIYDLTTLDASQSSSKWYFGFNANASNKTVTYVLYLDLDNTDGSGGIFPPDRNYQVSTNLEHQPEFVVYIDAINGQVNDQNTWIFEWDGGNWNAGKKISDLGGDVFYNAGYIELEIPDESIGMTEDTSSTSAMLFSVNTTDGIVQDTVPSDPSVPGPAILKRFSAVSEKMNLIFPPNTSTGDPSSYPSVMPFYWDWPTGSNGATPFAGSTLQVDLDGDFSPPHEVTFQINSSTSYFSENNITLLNDIMGDNLYYWRVQPRYLAEGHPEALGAWTGGWSFQRQGFLPDNLHTSTTNSIVSFSWDMAEGADSYQLQIATGSDFNNPIFDITTSSNSYFLENTLPQGKYFWRVRIIRFGNVKNAWAQGEPFEYILPSPAGLSSYNNQPIDHTPTLCWDPTVLFDPSGRAEFNAWKYHVEVSNDPGFGYIYDSTDTNSHCWTPTRGYSDSTYYWHVAIYDAGGRMGPYSEISMFTKQYPAPLLVNPDYGPFPGTPVFIWNPIDGAASYLFEASRYPSFSSIYDTVETVSLRYSPTKDYDLNRVYYWRVAIRDKDGVFGPYNQSKFQIGQVNFIYLAHIRR